MIITIPDEQPISWNKLYSGKFWAFRRDEALRVHQLVRAYIDPEVIPPTPPVSIKITSFRKSKRRFDPDNLCAKFYIDGLVPWVIPDDDYLNVSSVTTAIKIDKHNPRLVIEVTTAS